MEIFSIGHSNLQMTDLIAVLKQHRIAALVDVRSQPYSKHTPQFNQRALAVHLAGADIAYHYMGSALGGRPVSAALYGPGGTPDYDAMAAAPEYQAGIRQVIWLGERKRTAILCSEGSPWSCHREKLIARTLRGLGHRVVHLSGDGSIVEEMQPWLL